MSMEWIIFENMSAINSQHCDLHANFIGKSLLNSQMNTGSLEMIEEVLINMAIVIGLNVLKVKIEIKKHCFIICATFM